MNIDKGKLQKLMAEKCLLVTDLQKMSKLNLGTVYRLVNEGGRVRFATAGKLAAALNVPVDAIITD